MILGRRPCTVPADDVNVDTDIGRWVMATTRFSRRRFIGMSAGTAGFLAAGGLGAFVLPACETVPPPGATNPARNPLFLPPTMAPIGAALEARSTTIDFGSGTGLAHAYNGTVPGPTLVANRGDVVSVPFTNSLTAPSSVHWHGLVVPTAADGQPHEAVAAGGTYTYDFTLAQRASLNFYHPHPHLMTAEQVALGLAGGILVRDAEEAALGLPDRWREVPLVIRDALFDGTGNLAYKPKSSGFVGTEALVNGTRAAKHGVDNALYRFRVVQGSNARVFRLARGDGAPFTVIGNDGGLLPAPVQVNTIDLGPGERLDLLLDLRAFHLGDRVMLRCVDAGWDVLELEVTREVTDSASPPPGPLSTVEALGNPVRTRTFSFDGMGRINGQEFSMDRIDFQVPFGDIERWRFTTGGNAPHPVHTHGASFQVEARTGGRAAIMPWEAGWKDTVLLQDGETVDVLIRFDGHRGRYLIHCHQLEHEDRGMMQAFEVV
jgi:FtsP/CotA-like multicopper oxidase with cupredoxin domain